MQDIWLPPNTPNSKVVGMFAEETHEYVDSKGERKSRTLTVLRHKIPGSLDSSTTLCKDNPDGAKIKAEWSKAWDFYQQKKAAAPVAEPVPTAIEVGIKGTPIETADFIGKDRLAFFKAMGFLTIEQLRDMSDTVCQGIMGAKALRKKAKEFLAVKRAA